MQRYSREDLAWVAGFFDGEGSVGKYRAYVGKNGVQRYAYRLYVGQKDPELLYRLQRILGFGHVAKDGRRNCWIFRTERFDCVQALCALMWTWLSRKRKDQFIAALKGGN